jgi:diaminopimelate epimerase
MGPARLGGAGVAVVGGVPFDGVGVDVGNPHLACVTDLPVGELDLTVVPGFDAGLFPRGVNIEFLSPLDADDAVTLRVHERGVGETRACGTGTVAAAVAALRHAGRDTGTVTAHVPGGTLEVEVDPVTTVLTGPAVLVAHGVLDAAWWRAAGITQDAEGVVVGA